MKKLKLISLAALIIFISADDPGKLLNKKMPQFTGVTLSNKKIDASYFKNKVTLINFMYLGCPPCMMETQMLNDFNKNITDTSFQILCISPHTANQLKVFNSSQGGIYQPFKEAFKVDSLTYELMPECDKLNPKAKPNVIAPECNTISKLFHIDGYPATFLVDKKGIVRKVYNGFVTKRNAPYEESIKDEIKKLIKE